MDAARGVVRSCRDGIPLGPVDGKGSVKVLLSFGRLEGAAASLRTPPSSTRLLGELLGRNCCPGRRTILILNYSAKLTCSAACFAGRNRNDAPPSIINSGRG